MSNKIITAGKDDTQTIREIAIKSWEVTYVPITGREQVDYMLEEIYSIKALQKQMDDGHEFLLLYTGNVPAGFLSYNLKSPARFRIHKLYVDPDIHGKGIGKALLDEMISRVRKKDAKEVELNVNRYNKAKGFYDKYGFKTIKLEDIAFGKYWMNDYLMVLEL